MRLQNVKNATPEEIRELQKVELGILNQLAEILKQKNLKFFLLGGTMIGAVRNKGFVPWDDDVDVIIPRKDYEILYSHADEWFKDTNLLLVRSDENSNQHITGMNLKDKRTTFINQHSIFEDLQHSIGIDINPLDFRPVGKVKQLKQVFYAAVFSLYNANRLPDHQGALLRMASAVPLKMFSEKTKTRIWQYSEKKMIELNDPASGEIVELGVGLKALKRHLAADLFSEQKWVPFEDTYMPIPIGFDKYLSDVHGDYMSLPPEEHRIAKHQTYLVDTEQPYTPELRDKVLEGLNYEA